MNPGSTNDPPVFFPALINQETGLNSLLEYTISFTDTDIGDKHTVTILPHPAYVSFSCTLVSDGLCTFSIFTTNAGNVGTHNIVVTVEDDDSSATGAT